MHFYGWKKGLKTGMYYLRSRPAVDAIKFTVDQGALAKDLAKEAEMSSTEALEQNMAAMSCSLENRDACLMCSG